MKVGTVVSDGVAVLMAMLVPAVPSLVVESVAVVIFIVAKRGRFPFLTP